MADEANFWSAEDGSNPASEVLGAIRPGLVTLRRRLIVVTSPFAEDGPVWESSTRYFGVDVLKVVLHAARCRWTR